MRPSRRLYITACQRLLALGVVVVALVPATGVVSLDVVGVAPTAPVVPRQPLTPAVPTHTDPVQGRPMDHGDELVDYTEETERESEVPTAPVDPVVREVALTAKRAEAPARSTSQSAPQKSSKPRTEVVSDPQEVTGVGAVGVTWEHGDVVPEQDISVQVRTEDEGAWSDWSDLTYHDDHGPDPASEEGRQARPGTDPTVIGDVDNVQVRVEMADGSELPADLNLAVVDPGDAAATEEEAPAIDTAELPSSEPTDPAEPTESAETTPDESLVLRAATTAAPGPLPVVTPKPKIYSRAQWGADESMRSGTPSYFEVRGGFVHHTVNANDYKRRDVPAILRSIYAYHTRSRGWSDIGYNFLVDRFGRIWEGRAGGVDRPVVGAHTLNYNSYSFAMSAIGNFETAQPTTKMLQAYGALFAWKLSLHGVAAGSTVQRIGSRNFQAINGHRDAASTACPGKYLYAKIPEIRRLAAAAQASWSGREVQRNLAGAAAPDLVVRRVSDGQGVVLPLWQTEQGLGVGKPLDTGINLAKATAVLSVGDWDRDGFNDIVTRSKKGALRLWRGDGTGRFATAPLRLGSGFRTVSMLAAVGDMTGDGYPDLMGQPAGTGMRIYPGAGAAGLGASFAAYSTVTGTQLVGVGRWDSDGTPDVMVRNGSTLTTWSGNGPGGLSGPTAVQVSVAEYDWVVGIGDMGLTGHPDLVVKKRGGGKLWLVPGTTTGFETRVLLGRGFRDYDLVG